MSPLQKRTITLSISLLLAACGGGGGGNNEPGSTTGNTSGSTGPAPAATTSPGTTDASENTHPAPTPTSPAQQPAPDATRPFTASLSIAPTANAFLSNIVTMEVRGSGMRNVELVPPDSPGPVIARFDVVDESVAVLHLDTRTMLNGLLVARILAYSEAPGEPTASVIEVMPPREWLLDNQPQPPLIGAIPPRNYRPRVHIYHHELPFVDPAPLRALDELDDATLSARLAGDGPTIQALMDRYMTSQIWLATTGMNSGWQAWMVCRENLTLAACRVGFSFMIDRMELNRP